MNECSNTGAHGPDRPRLFCVSASGHAFREVSVLMAQAGFRLVHLTPKALANQPEGTGPILVEADEMRGDSFGWWLVGRRPGLGPWIGVHASTVRSPPLRLGARWSTEQPGGSLPFPRFCLNGERAALKTATQRAWVEALECRWSLGALGRPRRHGPARSAVTRILRQRPGRWRPRPPQVAVRDGRGGSPLLLWLAEEVRIWPDHLGRLAKKAGLALRPIHDTWRVILALVLRMEQETWAGAAQELGMESGAGLTVLMRRVLGCPPRGLKGDWGLGLGAAEARLTSLLSGGRAQHGGS